MNGMDNRKLSIIIPTYNGGKYLSQNLVTLIPMMKECDSEEVELIISNNASTDNTDEIVQNALNEYPLLKYIKRDTNIGAMSNFYESVKESSGRFVFLLGDDDVLMPGFINVILNIINQFPDVSIIHWNRIDYVEKTQKSSLYNTAIDMNGVSYYDSIITFLKEHATMDSMSTVLFSRTCWEKGEKYVKDDYYGYLWYSRILFGAIGGNYVYSFFPLVIQRHPLKQTWFKSQALYTAGLFNIYRDLDAYCPGIYKYLLENHALASYSYFVSQMYVIANNKSYYKDKFDIIKQHMSRGRRCFCYLVTFVFPKAFSNIIIYVLKVVKYLKRHLYRKLI
jgi:glycosyltransferase involved in cell wall biosynthesis